MITIAVTNHLYSCLFKLDMVAEGIESTWYLEAYFQLSPGYAGELHA